MPIGPARPKTEMERDMSKSEITIEFFCFAITLPVK